jgi:DNA replication protein DnaC
VDWRGKVDLFEQLRREHEFGIGTIAGVTTNLPFSEWSQVIPQPRLCKALIDRLTDQAHIITTGADSYRFRRTAAQRKGGRTGGHA